MIITVLARVRVQIDERAAAVRRKMTGKTQGGVLDIRKELLHSSLNF